MMELSFFCLYLLSFLLKKDSDQLPQQHLSYLQNLLNFIITKYLKKEVDGKLNVFVDERSSSGLSVTGDIKIYHCHVIKR